MIESVLPDDVKYVKAETFFTTDTSGLIVDPQQIADLKQYRLLCVNASDEDHGRGHQEIYHRRLNDLDHDFLLLTGDITAHDPSKNIYWYQDSYHWSLRNFKPRDLNIQSPRAWDFSCVSRHSRPHRILFYLKLRNKDLWSSILFTLGNKHPFPRNDDVALTDGEHHEWSQQSEKFEIYNFSSIGLGGKLASFYDEPYINAYINIVLETTCNSLAHTTEKTWKPIAAGQLFLIYGNQDTIKLLRQQGIDTFDDYINHDLYDSEPDARRRCDLVIAAAERLAQQDISKIWHDTYQRRMINQEKFWKGDFVTHHYDQLKKAISHVPRG
jgi:hypothetical protein